MTANREGRNRVMHRLMWVAAAALVLAAPARADQTFTDATGDNGPAHDITSVVVSNDATQVVLRFSVPNPWPNLRQAEDQAWLLMIDADRNPSTGDGGEEVRVFQQSGAFVEVWNGSAWVDAPPAGISVRFELSSSSAAWRVQLPRELLGGTTGFDFRLAFAKWAGDAIVGSDRGPDSGSWRYALVLTQCANGRDDDGDGKVDTADRGCAGTSDDAEGDEPVTPRLLRASAAPVKVGPGRPVTIRATAQVFETGEPLSKGSVVCAIRVGTATKRVTGRVSAGVATCKLTAPSVSRPTTVRGTMAIAGATRAVPFSFRVG
jgi:hypothetical protein